MRDIESIAEEFRAKAGLGDDPIGDIAAEAERRGVVVSRMDLLPRQLDAFSCWMSPKRAVIVLDANRPAVRQRLDIAHELGHLILHSELDPSIAHLEELEEEAFRFGSALLIPRRRFVKEVLPSATLSSLIPIKRRWKVSLKMLIHRAGDLEVIGSERIQQLYKQYSSAGYARSGEPLDEVISPEEPRLLRQAVETVVAMFSPTELAQRVPFPPSEMEPLCGLPKGSLGPGFVPPNVRKLVQGDLF